MKDQAKYGQWAFLGGMVIAIIVGLASGFLGGSLPIVLGVLAVLGLIVGLLNITEKEVTPFLIATIALLAVPSSLAPMTALVASTGGGVGTMMVSALNGFLGAIAVFISPAAFVVAIKAIYQMAQPGD
jgi:hypothetical protein